MWTVHGSPTEDTEYPYWAVWIATHHVLACLICGYVGPHMLVCESGHRYCICCMQENATCRSHWAVTKERIWRSDEPCQHRTRLCPEPAVPDARRCGACGIDAAIVPGHEFWHTRRCPNRRVPLGEPGSDWPRLYDVTPERCPLAVVRICRTLPPGGLDPSTLYTWDTAWALGGMTSSATVASSGTLGSSPTGLRMCQLLDVRSTYEIELAAPERQRDMRWAAAGIVSSLEYDVQEAQKTILLTKDRVMRNRIALKHERNPLVRTELQRHLEVSIDNGRDVMETLHRCNMLLDTARLAHASGLLMDPEEHLKLVCEAAEIDDHYSQLQHAPQSLDSGSFSVSEADHSLFTYYLTTQQRERFLAILPSDRRADAEARGSSLCLQFYASKYWYFKAVEGSDQKKLTYSIRYICDRGCVHMGFDDLARTCWPPIFSRDDLGRIWTHATNDSSSVQFNHRIGHLGRPTSHLTVLEFNVVEMFANDLDTWKMTLRSNLTTISNVSAGIKHLMSYATRRTDRTESKKSAIIQVVVVTSHIPTEYKKKLLAVHSPSTSHPFKLTRITYYQDAVHPLVDAVLQCSMRYKKGVHYDAQAELRLWRLPVPMDTEPTPEPIARVVAQRSKSSQDVYRATMANARSKPLDLMPSWFIYHRGSAW